MPSLMAETARENVTLRLGRWRSRLESLSDRIAEWAGHVEGARVLRAEVSYTAEGAMRRLGIEDAPMPGIAVIFGERRVAFVPFALEVPGTQGLVNVATKSGGFSLVDVGSEFEPCWILRDGGRGEEHPFDEEAFRRLLLEEYAT